MSLNCHFENWKLNDRRSKEILDRRAVARGEDRRKPDLEKLARDIFSAKTGDEKLDAMRRFNEAHKVQR